MKIENTFREIIKEVIEDNTSWNKMVKHKEYTINDSDTSTSIEAKVYRYLNIHGDAWKNIKTKAKYKTAAKLYYKN